MGSPEENSRFDFENDRTNSDSILSDILLSSGDSIGIAHDIPQSSDLNFLADSGAGDEQAEEVQQRNWAELPSLAVENIYSFLSRTDQSRMSLVCSRWADDFHSPSLWKTIKFYLPEQDYSSEIYPEVRFARKYACMFRHVEIICKRVRNHLIGVIWKQLKMFLQAMEASSQLTSIKLINMRNYFRRLDDIILYEDLFRTIINFFNSQRNLKTIVFECGNFSKEEGMELLKAIFHSDNNVIRNLTLRGFVNEDPLVELSPQYVSNLSLLCDNKVNLQSLETDYTQIFEDLINCLFKNISSGDYPIDKKKLFSPTFNIYCDGARQSNFSGILPRTWKYLANFFPDLKVKMDITIHSHLNREMEQFLVAEIPLQALDFRFDMSLGVDISDLLRHFQACKYQNHLELLNILWMPSIGDFAESVIPFVQSCKKLKIFHLHAKCMPSEIENILKEILENHPTSLKSITLWFNYCQENVNEGNVKALAEEYFQMFNIQGIEFFLFVEPRRTSRRRQAGFP